MGKRNEPTSGLLIIEGDSECRELLVVCPDLAGKMTIPLDEFVDSAGLKERTRILLFDRSRRFLLSGLDAVAPTFQALLAMIRLELESRRIERLVICGASGGGHSALLLGHLLHADYVVAFAPFPYLSRQELVARADPQYVSMGKVVRALDDVPDDCRRYFDLREVLSEWNGKSRYLVHLPRYQRDDVKRGRYLAGLPGVDLVFHPARGHGVAA